MAEYRLRLEDKFLGELRETLGQDLKVGEIIREALTLYYWALRQRRLGRVILSGNEDGEAFLRVSQLSLDRVQPDPEAVRHAAASDAAEAVGEVAA